MEPSGDSPSGGRGRSGELASTGVMSAIGKDRASGQHGSSGGGPWWAERWQAFSEGCKQEVVRFLREEVVTTLDGREEQRMASRLLSRVARQRAP